MLYDSLGVFDEKNPLFQRESIASRPGSQGMSRTGSRGASREGHLSSELGDIIIQFTHSW